jgi:hypothetical protein
LVKQTSRGAEAAKGSRIAKGYDEDLMQSLFPSNEDSEDVEFVTKAGVSAGKKRQSKYRPEI